MVKVFISYSSIDKSFVRKLSNDISANGIDIWLDQNNIKPGDSIVSKINKGLCESDFTLLVISSYFLKSEWAIWESNWATNNSISKKRTSVIPILIEDVWNDVSPLLRDKKYLDFRSHQNLLVYRSSLAELVSTILVTNEEIISK